MLKPSKSDNPEYRKSIWPVGKVMGSHNQLRQHVSKKPKRVRKSRAKA